MTSYYLSDFAKRELDDIWDFYFENVSQSEANRRVAHLSDHFELLAEFPHMGRARPEYASGIRSHIAHPYVIWYYIWPSQIEISRIVHGSQDVSQLFADIP